MCSSTRKALCAMAFVLAFSATAPTWASAEQSLNWAFQDTSIPLSGGYGTALAMRNGEAWPVIFTDTPYTTAYTLFPGGPGGPGGSPGSWLPGNWQSIGANLTVRRPSRMRAATSPDGRVLVTGAYGTTEGAGGAISNATAGWSMLPANTRAAAFGSDGSVYTATKDTVSGASRYTGAPVIDMAVSPGGDIGVVDAALRYWHYSPWLGAWLSANLASLGPIPSLDSLDLAFDAKSRPHIIGAGSTVVAYDFSTITGTWTMTTLASNVAGPAMALAADSQGGVGSAWVTPQDGSLIYAYKDDNGSWTTSMVAATIPPQRMVGIAYDYADRPVLSYLGQSNRISLAYDPSMVIPEPLAIGVVMFCGLMLVRRRGR